MEPLTATLIATLILTKAFEKTGEKLGEAALAQGGKLLTVLRRKSPDTALAIEKVAQQPQLAEQEPENFGTATLVGQVEAATADPEVKQAVDELAEAARSQPATIQNMTKLAEKIGIVNQGSAIGQNTFLTGQTIVRAEFIKKNYHGDLNKIRWIGATESISLLPSLCYIYAEIDPSVILNRVTTVEVTVSLEQLEAWITSNTSQSGKAEIETNKHLIIQVIPKTNFEMVGESRVELDPKKLAQTEGAKTTLYFDIRPTHRGEGEVWVILRQGQVSLLTLTLTPQIVESRSSRAAFTAMSLSSTAPSLEPESKLKASGSIEEIPKLTQPLHQLRIFEKRNGTQVSYHYELQSPMLDILESYESAAITNDRHQYVENLYREIESRWHNAQAAMETFDAELRAFGGQLFDELFPLKLQQRLWTHRHEIESIMVISTEPFIPWELVHLKQPGENYLPDETFFLGQMGLVRWLHEAGWAPEQIEIRTQRTRYVIPHYPANSGYRLPQAEAEAQFLETRLGATAVEPQPNSVRNLVAIGNFDLLHFACHGTAQQNNIANAKLLMEGQIEGSKYIKSELSATTVEQYSNFKRSGNRPIVVLNSCQTGRTGYTFTGVGGFARAFLKGGAGAFVGALWSIGDRSARIFTETFYLALLEGATLAEATLKARAEARRSGDATWLAYAVYGHPHMKIKPVS